CATADSGYPFYYFDFW
nr:immunoglobulin heavy chain junction region [Macaca mulatta]MOX58616.1 immunoglobulin heavy chain junction region [Macaca mulatta]MOX59644.1 immunoglobulin heavy chain junction region [Macaca mulatta]MOX64813.1 immunoglobulin heavy chain junction region [Macaca mulatta]MOX64905.1 immunoglobulin heavy chain junction region [Macaca mulatta]